MALGYTSANIESSLHAQITAEAARNKLSFSKQIRDYMNHIVKLEEQVSNLMTENKETKDALAASIKALKERRK